jgi:hypothetical protein
MLRDRTSIEPAPELSARFDISVSECGNYAEPPSRPPFANICEDRERCGVDPVKIVEEEDEWIRAREHFEESEKSLTGNPWDILYRCGGT